MLDQMRTRNRADRFSHSGLFSEILPIHILMDADEDHALREKLTDRAVLVVRHAA